MVANIKGTIFFVSLTLTKVFVVFVRPKRFVITPISTSSIDPRKKKDLQEFRFINFRGLFRNFCTNMGFSKGPFYITARP